MVAAISIVRGVDNLTYEVFIDATNAVTVDRTGIQSLLTGQDRQDIAIVSAAGSDLLQMLWDFRQLLTDLPVGDPDITIDPARFDFFHARIVAADQLGQGGNAVDIFRPTAVVGGTATHLVARTSLLTVVYTGDIATSTLETQTPPRSFR